MELVSYHQRPQKLTAGNCAVDAQTSMRLSTQWNKKGRGALTGQPAFRFFLNCLNCDVRFVCEQQQMP